MEHMLQKLSKLLLIALFLPSLAMSQTIVNIEELRNEIPTDLNQLVVINKNDLGVHESYQSIEAIRISCVNESGINDLCEAVASYCLSGMEVFGDDLVAVNSRHRSCLELSRKHLIEAKESLRNAVEAEYVSLDIRAALDSVGEIVGKADVEDLLGEIFGSFCIGK